MRRINSFFYVVLMLALLVGCSKENTDNTVFEFTPEELVALAGKNWNSVSGRFKNKKDYVYSELSTPTTLAAISLPAIDKGAPLMKYRLLFNLDKENRISIVNLGSTDTLDVEKGCSLMLYYYDRVFAKLEGAFDRSAYDGTGQRLTADELIAKLRLRNVKTPSFSYRTPQVAVGAAYLTINNSFSFEVTPF